MLTPVDYCSSPPAALRPLGWDEGAEASGEARTDARVQARDGSLSPGGMGFAPMDEKSFHQVQVKQQAQRPAVPHMAVPSRRRRARPPAHARAP
jgi:hypothetical protein